MTTTQVSVDSLEITNQGGHMPTGNAQVSFERFAITNPAGRSIHFVDDDDLTVILKSGGDESARHAEAGIVVVLLGIDGEGFDYVKANPARGMAGTDGQVETLRAARRSLDDTIAALEGLRASHAATR